MIENRTLTKAICFGMPFLFISLAVKGDPQEQPSIKFLSISAEVSESGVINHQPEKYINIEHLATEVLVDTAREFKAILYDYQSQETIASLTWNDSDSARGIIKFNNGVKIEDIEIQISNIEAMQSSERYNTLLRGLHEAGIAWLSQFKTKSSPADVNSDFLESQFTVQPLATGRSPIGYIDNVWPQANPLGPGILSNIDRMAGGWAYDPDRSSESTWVHLYGRTIYEPSQYRYIGAVFANGNRPDVNRVMNVAGQHGWTYKIPEAWDADDYNDLQGMGICANRNFSNVYWRGCHVKLDAYGIDRSGDLNKLLTKSGYPYGSGGEFPR